MEPRLVANSIEETVLECDAPQVGLLARSFRGTVTATLKYDPGMAKVKGPPMMLFVGGSLTGAIEYLEASSDPKKVKIDITSSFTEGTNEIKCDCFTAGAPMHAGGKILIFSEADHVSMAFSLEQGSGILSKTWTVKYAK